MANIKKLSISSIGRNNNACFVDLQRATHAALPRDDEPCFGARLNNASGQLLKSFHHCQLSELLKEIRTALEISNQPCSLYIIKLNAARANPIHLAPYELKMITDCSLLDLFTHLSAMLVKHPLAPHEAFEYVRQ